MPYYIVPPGTFSIEENVCNQKKIEVIRITIRNFEFDLCVKIANNYDSKTWIGSDYRKGLLNNKPNEEFNTEEVGTFAERAICKLFGLIQDGNNKKGGCDFDYIINNNSFDAKCSKEYIGKNFIKAIHETGYKCNLKSNFYFLAYINSKLTNRNEKIVVVDIVGTIDKKSVEKINPTPSPTKSKHSNYEITYDNPNIISIIQVYNRIVAAQLEGNVKQQIDGVDFELPRLNPISLSKLA